MDDIQFNPIDGLAERLQKVEAATTSKNVTERDNNLKKASSLFTRAYGDSFISGTKQLGSRYLVITGL